MNKFLSSAINSAVNDNKADLLKSIAASNKIRIGSASTSAGGFTLTNIKQANKVDTTVEANFVQKIATKVVNDVGNKLKEAIDMATKESSDSDKKLTSDEKSGTSVGDVVGQVAGAIGDTVSDVLSVSIGNSTNTENSAEELKKVMKKYTLNENVEVKKNNEVTSALSNVFKSENLSKCAGNSAAANELDIGKIDVNGPIVISEIDQSNVINDVMKCAFDQEVMNSDKPVLVDFWAEWCGPCKALSPVLDEIASEMSGKATVVKVNVDQASDLAQKYGIRGIPTLIFFKNGEVKSTLVGNQPKAEIVKNINSLIG
jgi:thioredoxin 1